ncbi:hypothetical protein XFEB_00183 [Xylella fastidiosa EB92.1]|nr:hypothetical protein XFEB_00183 [Xylella fastidiosa EB92.1]
MLYERLSASALYIFVYSISRSAMERCCAPLKLISVLPPEHRIAEKFESSHTPCSINLEISQSISFLMHCGVSLMRRYPQGIF